MDVLSDLDLDLDIEKCLQNCPELEVKDRSIISLLMISMWL